MHNSFQKIDTILRPLKKGELFLVPCIVRKDNLYSDNWIDGNPDKPKLFITPVINHPHSDKENGQAETHYHIDHRFLKHDNDGDLPKITNNHSKYFFGEHLRPQEELHGNLHYYIMPVINEDFKAISPVNLIAKSKLKHNCIYKNKCPHRGYDLSQVKAVGGKITCPLHGLQFDAITETLLNDPTSTPFPQPL